MTPDQVALLQRRRAMLVFIQRRTQRDKSTSLVALDEKFPEIGIVEAVNHLRALIEADLIENDGQYHQARSQDNAGVKQAVVNSCTYALRMEHAS